MKKIMDAVRAAAMLADTVTIADVSFSYKNSNYFSPASTNGVSNNNVGYLERTDCLTAGIASGVAGVVVDFDTRDVLANTEGIRLFNRQNGNVSDYRHVSTFSTSNTNNLGKRHVTYRERIL